MSETSMLTPSASVRDVQTPDGVVLLDIVHGLCISMNPITARAWQLLKSRCSIEEISGTFAKEFQDVDRKRIQSDISEFVTDLNQKKLLVAYDDLPQTPFTTRLLSLFHTVDRRVHDTVLSGRFTLKQLTVKAFLGLLAYDILRFGNSFNKIHSFVKSFPVANKAIANDAIEKVSKAIDHACVIYPKRVLCLQRSLVMTCLARSCGVAATMVIGVQKTPLKSHAWTEVDGTPINERRPVQSIYLVWDRC